MLGLMPGYLPDFGAEGWGMVGGEVGGL